MSPNNTGKVVSLISTLQVEQWKHKEEECSHERLTSVNFVIPLYPKMHLLYRPIGTQLESTVQKRWKISQGLSGEPYSIWIHLGGQKYFHVLPGFHLISFLSFFWISVSLSRMTSDLYYFPEDRNVFQSSACFKYCHRYLQQKKSVTHNSITGLSKVQKSLNIQWWLWGTPRS